MTPSLLALAGFAVAAFAAAMVQGMVALGFPMLMTPVLSLVLPVREAIMLTLVPTLLVNLINFFSAPVTANVLRRHGVLALGSVAGSSVGVWLLLIVPSAWLQIALALFVLLYVGLSTRRTHLRLPDRLWLAALFGFVAGVVGGATNVMAPVLMMYLLARSTDAGEIAQAASLCFFLGKIVQLVMLYPFMLASPYVTWANVAGMSVLAVSGVLLGVRVRRHVSFRVFRVLVLGIVSVLAITLLWRSVPAVWAGLVA